MVDETQLNLTVIALYIKQLIDNYYKTLREDGFFLSLGSKEFGFLFAALFLVYNLTFHGTHFERIPVCFFISVIFYSGFSRFWYYIAFLQRWLPIDIIFNIAKIISALVGLIFFIFYGILKPFTLIFLTFILYDLIDDIIESTFINYYIITRISCFIAFCITFYLLFRFYKWLKGGYEIFFCVIFAAYGAIVFNLAISQLTGFLTGFVYFVKKIGNSGLLKSLGIDGNSIFWFVTAAGAFTYQTRYINEDYLNDKLPVKNDKKEMGDATI